MRGKVVLRCSILICVGITPAYAGKRFEVETIIRCDKDHPRLCGEKSSSSFRSATPKGSPPPMRGKVLRAGECLAIVGITPAYAGKRIFPFRRSGIYRDHPRLCGEKHDVWDEMELTAGSPPPMRGKAENACVTDEGNRITPAYAGKSYRYSFRKICNKDHPRLCGEKRFIKADHKTVPGSPPPMRGKAYVLIDVETGEGNTPAYAGKSQSYQ